MRDEFRKALAEKGFLKTMTAGEIAQMVVDLRSQQQVEAVFQKLASLDEGAFLGITELVEQKRREQTRPAKGTASPSLTA